MFEQILFQQIYSTKVTFDFKRKELKRVNVKDTIFDNCSFEAAAGTGSKFSSTEFNKCDFSGSNFQDCYFNACKFNNEIKTEFIQ